MELVRRLSKWARLSEPGMASFALQACLGALLVLVFWVLDAFVDYLLFSGSSFTDFLLKPSLHDMGDFALIVFLVCLLLLYSRRAHRVEAGLEEALQHALERAEAEKAKLTRQTLELQQANQELEAFCQAISHDMRAPLTRVYSSAQELKGYRDLLDDNGRFFVDLVHDGCVQMETLLDSLMVLCRVTEVELACAGTDLVPIALEIAAQLRHDYPGHGVDFRTPERLVVHGDPQLLRVVLENLLSNAWKYTKGIAEPVVELGSFASEQGETVVSIRDNGAGFDGTRAGQLFQPFKRLHTYREFPGTGLGLATVRRIIRRHNGRVWGEGEPGRGATFYFTLTC